MKINNPNYEDPTQKVSSLKIINISAVFFPGKSERLFHSTLTFKINEML